MALPKDVAELDVDELELEEGEEGSSGGSKIVLWLIIAGLLVLFFPLYVVSTTIQSSTETLTSELSSIEMTLSATVPVNPTQKALEGQFASVQQQNQAASSLQSTLVAAHINWPRVMAAIGAFDINQMYLMEVTQTEMNIRISGRAQQEGFVMAYAELLRQSNLFEAVSVDSISMQDVMPTATLPATALPPEATPNGTPVIEATAAPIRMAEFVISVTVKKEAGDGRST
ncbi:MAG: PilN domain-containing protein [Anaerolineae bacterium]|mgnify:FL=1|nr:PilN domain-containing protein [Anaerolineae bacterium]